MGTPGRAKALRALGAAKRKNRARINKGEAPIVGGKKVSASTFKKTTGESTKEIKEGGPPGKSTAKSKSAIEAKWGSKAVGHGCSMGLSHGDVSKTSMGYRHK